MAKYTKEQQAAINKQWKDLLNLLLKKTGTNHKDLVDFMNRQFIMENIDVLTPAEKKKFDLLVL